MTILAKQNKRKAPIGQPNNSIIFDIPEPRHCRKSDIDSMDEICESANNSEYTNPFYTNKVASL